MNYPKQVIVVRKDLKMPAGKALAQVAHASMATILQRLTADYDIDANEVLRTMDLDLGVEHDRALNEWLTGSFTKVVLGVDSEEELEALLVTAKERGIPCSKIVDNGLTVFNGVPTLTCAGFGPVYSNVLDDLTGHLKLLNKL